MKSKQNMDPPSKCFFLYFKIQKKLLVAAAKQMADFRTVQFFATPF